MKCSYMESYEELEYQFVKAAQELLGCDSIDDIPVLYEEDFWSLVDVVRSRTTNDIEYDYHEYLAYCDLGGYLMYLADVFI